MRSVIAFATVAAMILLACAAPAAVEAAPSSADASMMRPLNAAANVVPALGGDDARAGRALCVIRSAEHNDQRQAGRMELAFGGITITRITVRQLLHVYLI